MLSEKELIEYNSRKHDQIAATEGNQSYDARHIEIFNPTEQQRLKSALDHALALRKTSNPRILDFGCGTGNLTEKLLGKDREVWATDVSGGMCGLVKRRFQDHQMHGGLKTETLTGEFPLPFPDNHFGFIATYSVLHHIPDYETAVSELVRILAPGGVLYIDHEASKDSWSPALGLRLYRLASHPYWGIPQILKRIFGMTRNDLTNQQASGYLDGLPDEGDIHIYSHDHIEWDIIEKIASNGGATRVPTKDYLACIEPGNFPIRHLIFRNFASNTGLFLGIKG